LYLDRKVVFFDFSQYLHRLNQSKIFYTQNQKLTIGTELGQIKTLKGIVAIEESNNRLRLRWACEFKRYCLALGVPYTNVNVKVAEQKARQIELEELVLK
jgi:hypothetical protein